MSMPTVQELILGAQVILQWSFWFLVYAVVMGAISFISVYTYFAITTNPSLHRRRRRRRHRSRIALSGR
ncbi:hypothetical protein [Clostridium butyricum]|uniref:hypothetical protein n=1 Tax=Clostridium butyricum TaxID=1492 RepID=UPI00374F3199